MPSHRPESVGKAVRVALTEILRVETRDPRLAEIMVTSVKMSKDLRTAKIFVSATADRQEPSDVIPCLNLAMTFLRRSLAQRVQLRRTPELVFALDDSIAHGALIEQLLNQLKP